MTSNTTEHREDLGMLQVNGIPKELRKRFKVECERVGSNMTEQIKRLMKNFVNRASRNQEN